MKNAIIKAVEDTQIKQKYDFQVGDTVDVHQRILEGEKERTQIYSGVVISRRGEGAREMFTVRRIVQGEGVERIFPIHSPKIAKIEVKRTGQVRRAQLFYPRGPAATATRPRPRQAQGPGPSATRDTAPRAGAAK